MPKSNLTHIIVVLDKSGSMNATLQDTIGGFNSFLESQLKVPGEATMSLCYFDTSTNIVYKSLPVKEVKPRDNKNYIPSGGTALLDAIALMIKSTGEDLNGMEENQKPEKVIFVIITDGEENSSKKYTREEVFKMITHQRDVYKWEFIFMGCYQDAIRNSHLLGIQAGNTLSYEGDSRGTNLAWESVTKGMASYRTTKGSTTQSFFKKP